MSEWEFAVKREKRFTRATLIDESGNEIGAALCEIRYMPESGIQPFKGFRITARHNSDGDVTLIIDQDPTTDWHIIRRLGRFRVGDTLTVDDTLTVQT